MDQAEIQRRRESFWELYSYDLLQVCGWFVTRVTMPDVARLVIHAWKASVIYAGAHRLQEATY